MCEFFVNCSVPFRPVCKNGNTSVSLGTLFDSGVIATYLCSASGSVYYQGLFLKCQKFLSSQMTWQPKMTSLCSFIMRTSDFMKSIALTNRVTCMHTNTHTCHGVCKITCTHIDFNTFFTRFKGLYKNLIYSCSVLSAG